MNSLPVSARIAKGVASIPAADWDACAGGGNPFVSHAFLSILERSGSVGAHTGWQSVPIVIDSTWWMVSRERSALARAGYSGNADSKGVSGAGTCP
ncbi:MAG: hypothetical protein EON54_24100 [Alcaligenaceae bacterium]|nr:MAG: hypothetical protein EON54_24100 [Alcaligenaceae bacterium]